MLKGVELMSKKEPHAKHPWLGRRGEAPPLSSPVRHRPVTFPHAHAHILLIHAIATRTTAAAYPQRFNKLSACAIPSQSRRQRPWSPLSNRSRTGYLYQHCPCTPTRSSSLSASTHSFTMLSGPFSTTSSLASDTANSMRGRRPTGTYTSCRFSSHASFAQSPYISSFTTRSGRIGKVKIDGMSGYGATAA